jgi:hypothetical protein
VRQKVSDNLLVVGATVLFAGVTAVLAHVHVSVMAGAAMILGGIATITVMSSFNTAAQTGRCRMGAGTGTGTGLVDLHAHLHGWDGSWERAWGAFAVRFGVISALT